jgi:hypothetical protein
MVKTADLKYKYSEIKHLYFEGVDVTIIMRQTYFGLIKPITLQAIGFLSRLYMAIDA